MKKHGTVPQKQDTTRQALEFGAALLKQAPHLTPEEMQYWIKNQSELQATLAKALVIPDPRRELERFYLEVFGLTVDFSDLSIPEKKEGFNWLTVMLQGLTANRLFDECKKRFAVWRYTNDLNAIKSVRTTEKTYAISVRDRIEADEENKNKSANDCAKEGINGITLEERLFLEVFYHWRTGKHLDIKNATFCSGSRDSDGTVPCVRWHGDEMDVDYCRPGSADGRLRARAAVS
ncbi:MAG: hypothetical protein NTX00_05325 [Candidatus Parcubacteria bacterium]|nr:hypothetical protein [Candidatus Parcubacteria bacterium]